MNTILRTRSPLTAAEKHYIPFLREQYPKQSLLQHTDLHFKHTYIYIYICMVPIGSPLGCSKYRFRNVRSIGFGYVLSTDFNPLLRTSQPCGFSFCFSKVCSKYKSVAIIYTDPNSNKNIQNTKLDKI